MKIKNITAFKIPIDSTYRNAIINRPYKYNKYEFTNKTLLEYFLNEQLLEYREIYYLFELYGSENQYLDIAYDLEGSDVTIEHFEIVKSKGLDYSVNTRMLSLHSGTDVYDRVYVRNMPNKVVLYDLTNYTEYSSNDEYKNSLYESYLNNFQNTQITPISAKSVNSYDTTISITLNDIDRDYSYIVLEDENNSKFGYFIMSNTENNSMGNRELSCLYDVLFNNIFEIKSEIPQHIVRADIKGDFNNSLSVQNDIIGERFQDFKTPFRIKSREQIVTTNLSDRFLWAVISLNEKPTFKDEGGNIITRPPSHNYYSKEYSDGYYIFVPIAGFNEGGAQYIDLNTYKIVDIDGVPIRPAIFSEDFKFEYVDSVQYTTHPPFITTLENFTGEWKYQIHAYSGVVYTGNTQVISGYRVIFDSYDKNLIYDYEHDFQYNLLDLISFSNYYNSDSLTSLNKLYPFTKHSLMIGSNLIPLDYGYVVKSLRLNVTPNPHGIITSISVDVLTSSEDSRIVTNVLKNNTTINNYEFIGSRRMVKDSYDAYLRNNFNLMTVNRDYSMSMNSYDKTSAMLGGAASIIGSGASFISKSSKAGKAFDNGKISGVAFGADVVASGANMFKTITDTVTQIQSLNETANYISSSFNAKALDAKNMADTFTSVSSFASLNASISDGIFLITEEPIEMFDDYIDIKNHVNEFGFMFNIYDTLPFKNEQMNYNFNYIQLSTPYFNNVKNPIYREMLEGIFINGVRLWYSDRLDNENVRLFNTRINNPKLILEENT